MHINKATILELEKELKKLREKHKNKAVTGPIDKLNKEQAKKLLNCAKEFENTDVILHIK